MNQMKITQVFILFIAFFLISLQIYSNNGFEDGYIITNATDTLYGQIKDRKLGTFSKLYTKIIFKNKKGRKKKYGAKDIIAYKRGGDEFVSLWFLENPYFFDLRATSVEGKGKILFFKHIMKGQLNYFYHEYVEENGIIDQSGYFKKEDDAEMIFVRTGLFGLNKKQLTSYFKDCPALQNKIMNKTFTKPYEIVNYYNNWILNESKKSI